MPKKIEVFIDTETYSTVDLLRVGSYRYAQDPTTEINLIQWALDDGPVHVWEPGYEDENSEFNALRTGIRNYPERYTVIAHGVKFDKSILERWFPEFGPVHLWRCCQGLALSMGLPRSLAELCKVLGLPSKFWKLQSGKSLIKKFGKPTRRAGVVSRCTKEFDFAMWELYRAYGIRDVEGLRVCWRSIPKWNYHGGELDFWELDLLINQRGVLIDTELVDAVQALVTKTKASIRSACQRLTSGGINNVTQRDAVLTFLKKEGLDLPDLKADTISHALEHLHMTPVAREMLHLRQQASMTSVSKFKKLKEVACNDDHVRGMFVYWGAHTGRETSEILQLQNLKKSPPADQIDTKIACIKDPQAWGQEDAPIDTASQLIRPAFVAEPGTVFSVADFVSIESRVRSWLADERWELEGHHAFDREEGPDNYKLSYAKAHNIHVDDVTDEDRKIGKVMDLAFGFQGWTDAFYRFAPKDWNISHEVVESIARSWRRTHPKTCDMWYHLEHTVKQAIHTGQNYKLAGGKLHIGIKNDWLLIRLPSGRFIAYYKPETFIDPNEPNPKRRHKINYWTRDSQTKRWCQVEVYGGMFFGNCVQAIAADLFRFAMLNLHKAGFDIRIHVHDEIGCQIQESEQFGLHDMHIDIMKRVPEWGHGLPINVDGYIARRFRK